MNCSRCGRKIPDGSKHCKYCGAEQMIKRPGNGENNKRKVRKGKGAAAALFVAAAVFVVLAALLIIYSSGKSHESKESQKENTESQKIEENQEALERQKAEEGQKEAEDQASTESLEADDREDSRKEPDEEQKKVMEELTFYGYNLLPYTENSTHGETYLFPMDHDRELAMYNQIAYETGREGSGSSLYPESRWENQGIDGTQGWGYVSSDSDEMRAFLKMVFGWLFEITNEDALMGYAERDGRIYGPGFGDGYEESYVEKKEPTFSMEDDGHLKVTLPCEEISSESGQVVNRGTRSSLWKYNPASPLYYTMDFYEETWEKPLYSQVAEESTGVSQKTEVGNQTAAAESPAALSAVNPGDMEEKIKYIRKVFYSIQAEYEGYVKTDVRDGIVHYTSPNGAWVKCSVNGGTDENPWSREYYYENGQLLFAFYFQKKAENRFYFWDGAMIRWIDESGTVHDNEFSNNLWSTWENQVKSDSSGVN